MHTFEVAEGVYGIDTELFDQGFTSVYLFDDDQPTLVDTGTAATADHVMDAMAECGVAVTDLENIVCSHIHVDHSGGAGALVDANPELDVYIHEMTAPHLADPSGLIASSRDAMGEHFEQMGEQRPVPESTITTVSNDGTTIDIGANSLELIHAPGHSPDHFAVWNPERDLLFAAECLGGYLERADNWFPPSTLPNFDVAQIDAAISNLEQLDPDQILLPHFGEWPHEPEKAFDLAERELYRFDDRILELYEQTGSADETKAAVADELLAVSPPYDESIESFYSSLITDGYLRYHGLI
jgi:glyoxylase-like metal-dependent hydrolase (beta-lactamase superfamily II)